MKRPNIIYYFVYSAQEIHGMPLGILKYCNCTWFIICCWSLTNTCSSSNTEEFTVTTSFEDIVRNKCLEKRGFKALDDNITLFRVVEAVAGDKVKLPCSYCGEEWEDSSRVWWWRGRTVDSLEDEVTLGLENNVTSSRVFTHPDHSLTILNVTANDTGMYFCRSLEDDNEGEETVVFKFSLDLVSAEVPVLGETEKRTWQKYIDETIMNTNKVIYSDENTDLVLLLDKVKLKVTSEWDPWQPCDGCKQRRRRFAKCRIRPQLNHVKYPHIDLTDLSDSQTLLFQTVAISCHSLDLATWFPYLSSLTRKVPNFLQTQPCFGDCTNDARGSGQPKYYLHVDMGEGDTQYFICPDSDLRSKVVWKKDSLVIKPASPPRTSKRSLWAKLSILKKPADTVPFVDRLYMLHLPQVKAKDIGVYVCYVNKKPIKGFNVTIYSAPDLEQRRRYMFWLLSALYAAMSTFIVVTGIAWATCNRRYFIHIPEDVVDVGNSNL